MYPRCHSEHFAYVNLFSPDTSTLECVLSWGSLYSYRNGGTDRLTNLPKISWLAEADLGFEPMKTDSIIS